MLTYLSIYRVSEASSILPLYAHPLETTKLKTLIH